MGQFLVFQNSKTHDCRLCKGKGKGKGDGDDSEDEMVRGIGEKPKLLRKSNH
jgi:hypothetical protein